MILYSNEVKAVFIFVPSYFTRVAFSISLKPCFCLNEKHIQHISYGWLHKRATITMIRGQKTETKPGPQEAGAVVREGGLSRWVDQHTVVYMSVFVFVFLCIFIRSRGCGQRGEFKQVGPCICICICICICNCICNFTRSTDCMGLSRWRWVDPHHSYMCLYLYSYLHFYKNQ